MENTPKVSVITGFYNRVNSVEQSVNSILKQTCFDFEFIIFDDCSSDGTYEKLLEFEKKDKRIHLIKHDINIGFVNGLSQAINLSKGDYIAIHGAGDVSLEHRLHKQKEILDNNKNIGVVGCYYKNKKNNEVLNVYKNPNGLNFQKTILKRSLFSHGEVMFRKNIYEKTVGYRSVFKYAQDRDLWCRFSVFSDYHIIEEVLYERHHDDPKSVNNDLFKRIKQLMYSDLAVQCMKDRNRKGRDIIDIYGLEALSFRKRTLGFSSKLAYLGILDMTNSNGEFSQYVCELLMEEKWTLRKILFLLMYYRVINRKIVKKIIEYIKRKK